MRASAVVLVNVFRRGETVDYVAVTDALLSAGIPLFETVLLPYDDPKAALSALRRLSAENEAVFLVCDEVLLSAAKEAVSAIAEGEFRGCLLEGNPLYATIPAGEAGRAVVSNEVVPAVDALRGKSFASVVLRTVAAPAEAAMHALKAATEAAQGKLSVQFSEKEGCGRIEIVYDAETPKVLCDEVVRILATELKDYLYALEDEEIGTRLFEALTLRRMRLSVAESFTGGAVGGAIVANPGASKVFFEGLNVYDRKAKEERLGVSPFTLKEKGPASNEVAYEMAAGLLKSGRCDVAIATTGVAGPESDGTGAPAGLCYIAVGTKERVKVFEHRLAGDRASVTAQAVNLALFHAYREIC